MYLYTYILNPLLRIWFQLGKLECKFTRDLQEVCENIKHIKNEFIFKLLWLYLDFCEIKLYGKMLYKPVLLVHIVSMRIFEKPTRLWPLSTFWVKENNKNVTFSLEKYQGNSWDTTKSRQKAVNHWNYMVQFA